MRGIAGREQAELKRLKAESAQAHLEFLRTDLTACFTLARLAETQYRAGDVEAAERSAKFAEDGYSTILGLVTDPKHADRISDDERQRLKADLEHLRATLDELKRAAP